MEAPRIYCAYSYCLNHTRDYDYTFHQREGQFLLILGYSYLSSSGATNVIDRARASPSSSSATSVGIAAFAFALRVVFFCVLPRTLFSLVAATVVV